MPTQAYRESKTKSVPAASRDRAVKKTVAAAEQMHREHEQHTNDPVNWEYDRDRGKYLNKVTGELADEPDTDIPKAGTLSIAAEEDEGFSITQAQYLAGIRLAISERSGLVRRCPECNQRRLLLVPKDGATFLVCANSMTDDPTCDFHRKQAP